MSIMWNTLLSERYFNWYIKTVRTILIHVCLPQFVLTPYTCKSVSDSYFNTFSLAPGWHDTITHPGPRRMLPRVSEQETRVSRVCYAAFQSTAVRGERSSHRRGNQWVNCVFKNVFLSKEHVFSINYRLLLLPLHVPQTTWILAQHG